MQRFFNNHSSKVLGLLLLLLTCLSFSVSAQKNEFIIEGRFKVDGGSTSDAKIIVEKDGRKVKTLEGESRFEIGLDYQAIYVVSFMKEGFVTKRIRFDTHVPEDRIEYGFEPFGFQVEIFEQYDDVNMVVFNQPVGKISYSELIDEFDYDTDYTKSIQSQLDKAEKDVEEAKKKKVDEEEKVAGQVDDLVKEAENASKDGNYTVAAQKLEEALELKKDPQLQNQLDDVKREQKKKEKEEEFKKALAEAEAAMAAGELEEAKRLFQQANGIIDGDKRVTDQLAEIQEEQKKQAQQAQAFDDATKAAKSALASGNFDDAITKAQAALDIKGDPAMEQLIADAQSGKDEAEAAAAAEAEQEEAYQALLAEAQSAKETGDFEAAIAKYEQAKAVKATPEVDGMIQSTKEAKAQMEQEQRRAEEQKAALDEAISGAEAALAAGNLEEAKRLLDEAKGLGEDERLSTLAKGVAEQEERIAAEAAAQQEKAAAIQQALTNAESAFTAGDLDRAEELFAEARELGAEDAAVTAGLDRIKQKREELAAQEQQKQEKLDALIADAESAFEASDFETAKTKLDEAESIKKDPRIAELTKRIDDAEAAAMKAEKKQEEIQEEYSSLVDQGSLALTEGNLDDAEKAFNKAVALLEGEAAAKDGLAKVEEERKKIAEQASQDEAAKAEAEAAAQVKAEQERKYLELIEAGEASLAADDLEAAVGSFNDAMNYSDTPSEAEAGLEKVESRRSELSAAQEEAAAANAEKQAAQKELERQEKYQALIASGDEALLADELDQAASAFSDAKSLNDDPVEAITGLEKVQARKKELASKEEASNAEEEAAKQAKEEARRKAEEEAAAAAAAAEAAALAAKNEKAKEQEAAKQKALAEKIAEGDELLRANRLNPALSAYQEALTISPANVAVQDKIAEVEALQKKLEAEKAKNQEAAVALTENRGRETEQLADIIEQEESKAEDVQITTETKPSESTVAKTVRMAQPAAEQDVQPGSTIASPVIISDNKVGEEARNTQTARMTDDEMYDGIQKRVEEQRREFQLDQEQQRLMDKYPNRKSVETEKVGTSFVTWVYMNNGKFVTIYKKVEHDWGGVYYFIDGRSTNQRYWEHETQ